MLKEMEKTCLGIRFSFGVVQDVKNSERRPTKPICVNSVKGGKQTDYWKERTLIWNLACSAVDMIW